MNTVKNVKQAVALGKFIHDVSRVKYLDERGGKGSPARTPRRGHGGMIVHFPCMGCNVGLLGRESL